MSFDIPRLHAERAWFNTQGQGSEAAADWYFTHMEDPSLNTPLNPVPGSGSGSGVNVEVDPAALAQLESMGFARQICERALRETKGNLERAADWLFSHMDEPMEEEKPEPVAAEPQQLPEDGSGRMYSILFHI